MDVKENQSRRFNTFDLSFKFIIFEKRERKNEILSSLIRTKGGLIRFRKIYDLL